MDDVSTQSSNNQSERIDHENFKEFRLICLNGEYTKYYIFCMCLSSVVDISLNPIAFTNNYVKYIESKMDPLNDNIFIILKQDNTPTDTLLTKCKELGIIIWKHKRYYAMNVFICACIGNCLYERYLNG